MRRKVLLLGALAAVVGGVLWAWLSAGSSGAAPALQVEDRVQKNASSDLQLTTTLTDVPGLSQSLDAGNWKIEVCLLFSEQGTGDEGQTAVFVLVQGSTQLNGAGLVRLYDSQFQTTCFNWLIDLSSDTTVKVQARKSAGTGTSKVLSGNESSRLVATEEP